MSSLNDGSKDIVERALSLVMALTSSRVGAVFATFQGREPELVTGSRLDQLGLERVKAAWTYGQDSLGCGQFYEGRDGGVVMPILADRELCALVYVDQRGECSSAELEAVFGLIRNRLSSSPAPVPQTARDEREHLLLMLERNEWNIARVARLLGVSRLTVYRWLGRLGLERPEGPKRAPGAATSGA